MNCRPWDPPAPEMIGDRLAALTVHVNGMRHDVESLATKVDTLADTQQEHAAVLDDITELRRQVEHILAILTEEDDAPPAAWFWLTMNG